MIAAPTPAIAILQNFNIDLLKELKPARGRQWWGNVTIADGSAKSVLPGVTGQPKRSWRAPITFATFRAWPCGGKLAIHERYRMARFTTLDGARKAGTKLSPSGRAATSILILRLTQSKSHEIVREFPAS